MQNKSIGQKLKELRLSRNYKQCDVADNLGLSRAAVSNIENGRRSLTLNTLQKFADFYKVDVSTITDEIEQNNKDEIIDLLERTRKVFNSNIVHEKEKEELYLELMKLYLNAKKQL